jgi:hypothetical protein
LSIGGAFGFLAENLEFTYVEINDRLSKFVPDKVWKSPAA